MSGPDCVRPVLRRSPRLHAVAQRTFVIARYGLLRKPHEPDFKAFRDLPGDGLFLDVGANSGVSAMSFRLYKPSNPILSLEPSALHVGDLRLAAKLVGNMRCMFCAAGREPGVLTLHVPYLRGTPLSQFASLDPVEASSTSWAVTQSIGDEAQSEHFEVRTEHAAVVRLDDLQLAPSFVKIDVQGFESEVLEGLAATIEQYRPVFLVEVGGDWEMVDHMRSLGYTPHIYDDALLPFEGKMPSANLFFLP